MPFLQLRLRVFPWIVGAAVFFLCDQNSRAGKEPARPIVPGFERFYTAREADAVQGGRLLLGELNCVSCHRPDDGAAGISKKPAPVLDGVGSRVKRSYLRKFLSDPQSVKPGTTMPHVFAGSAEKDKAEQIEALVHFFASTGEMAQERFDRKLINPGKDLYQKVGCVACHGSRDADGNAGKLLLTSVPLGDPKAKYSLKSLAAFLENPHQTRPGGRMPGLLVAKEAREVAHYLLQGGTYPLPPPNMHYAYYEGDWDRLPDFDKLKPIDTGKTEGFDLTVARRLNNMALKFEGHLRIDRDGDYRFHVTSDDGSKLFLDGKLIVDNDGIHAPATKSGTAKLAKGMHKLLAGVFNGPGGVVLNIDVEGPGLRRQPISSLVFLTPEGNPKPKKTPDSKEDEDFVLNPKLVEKGSELFATVGCASCHTVTMDKKPIASRLTAPDLAKLRGEGGCLDGKAGKTPWYGLSEAQRKALAAAIKAPPAAKPEAKEIIARTLTTFNCYACHDRDKKGGPEEGISSFFTTAQPEMGEEGRIPPSLNGVGAKLNPNYFKHILETGAHDRPYMHTRMPRFGLANVGHLVEAFGAVDSLEAVAAPKFAEAPAKIRAHGRHMVGALALGCIKCHTFAGHKAEGVQGIDMTLMPERLKRDWFHRYVLEPNKFRPGTRMPTAWPDGTSVLPKILDGDAAKQIEAIWVYLADKKKAALPVGLKPGFMPLIPDKEAIVYRNFIQGAGSRAIAVGYPEKAHLAFDANDMRLALIWQGAFIDASRHWTGRGEGFEPPLGDNILHLPTGPSFAVLAKDEEAWPTKSAKELGFRFGGYRLTKDQRPTFLYSFQEIEIEDEPNAVAGKSSPTLRRTLTLAAKNPPERLWFRAVAASKIEAVGKGEYRISGEWTMRIEAAAAPRIRQSGGQQELLVPIEWKDGRARMVQEFVW